VLYAFFPPDPGLRFYAPRPVRRVRDGSPDETRHLLLWEDEWREWRDADGDALRSLAVSDARPSSRGALALVLAPPGTLRRGTTSPSSGPPGLRATPDQNG
jgi:hypothetical protein